MPCLQAHPKVQELMYPMLRDDFQVVETYQVGRGIPLAVHRVRMVPAQLYRMPCCILMPSA